MEKFEFKQIKNLLEIEIRHLIEESKNEGFKFLERLMDEYSKGTNTFNKTGEILYGVFHVDGKLIAIGGLNKDPYANDQKIGRLRRFYVSKKYRRKGIGKILLKKIISFAKDHYNVIVLYTDTKQADDFYTSLGFQKGSIFPMSTHFFKF
jgi:GNAT superfamily N-acetyltransferase